MSDHKFPSWTKKEKGKGPFRLYRMKNSEKFMYVLSANTTTLFVFDAVACAQSSSWKGSPWCKAVNPRYKCQVRLSAFHLSPQVPSRLSSPREKLSFVIPRFRDCISSSTRTFLPTSISLPSRTFRSLLPAGTSPVLLPARNFDSSQSLSSTLIPISIILKLSLQSFPFSFMLLSVSSSPAWSYLFLIPRPSWARNNKRSTRGETAARPERNRADLRPGSEKAIWANRTPPTGGKVQRITNGPAGGN